LEKEGKCKAVGRLSESVDTEECEFMKEKERGSPSLFREEVGKGVSVSMGGGRMRKRKKKLEGERSSWGGKGPRQTGITRSAILM